MREETIMLVGLEAAFRFPWNISDFRFSTRSGVTSKNLRNEGNVEIPFSVTFRATGEVIAPKITKVVTGEFIWLKNFVMQTGDVIIIDMIREVTCTLIRGGVSSDIFFEIDEDSRYFTLSPGDNVLRIDADAGIDYLFAQAVKREILTAYWRAWV